jgi:hypothetical protein
MSTNKEIKNTQQGTKRRKKKGLKSKQKVTLESAKHKVGSPDKKKFKT